MIDLSKVDQMRMYACMQHVAIRNALYYMETDKGIEKLRLILSSPGALCYALGFSDSGRMFEEEELQMVVDVLNEFNQNPGEYIAHALERLAEEGGIKL